MPYPTPAEFRELLETESLDALVGDHIFEGVPYAFRDDREAEATLTGHLGRELGVDVDRIRIVGSARMGFSLAPEAYGRHFSDASDIDVIVIDPGGFDLVWRTILSWHYPRRYRLSGRDRRWDGDRKDDLYWGWFRPAAIRYDGLSLPDVLTPLRDLSSRWFDAFQTLSQYDPFATRKVSGRLYRTWEHASLYHVDSLRKLRATLRPNEAANGIQ